MPRKKNTARYNEIIKKRDPVYRWEISLAVVEGQVDTRTVHVFAHYCHSDGDELNFYMNFNDQEELVAAFKEWSFFIRRESDEERSEIKWEDRLDKLKRVIEASNDKESLVD